MNSTLYPMAEINQTLNASMTFFFVGNNETGEGSDDQVSPDDNSQVSGDIKEYPFDRLEIQILLFVLYTIVFCFCVFGNLMVILVVTLHWRMRTVTKFCLANLAFADFCVGVFCVYQNLSIYLINSWVLGEYLCKMYHFVNKLSHTSAVLILVVICVERYLAILHPFQCKRIMTKGRLQIVISAVWIVSGIYSSPWLYLVTTVRLPRPDMTFETMCIAKRDVYNSRLFDTIHFLLLFLLPLLVITILYTCVGITLWNSSLNSPRGGRHQLQRQGSREPKRSTSVKTPAHNSTRLKNSPTGIVNGTVKSGKGPQGGPFPGDEPANGSSSTTLLSSNGKRHARMDSTSVMVTEDSTWGGGGPAEVSSRRGGQEALKSRQRVVRMMIVLVVSFAVCNFPFHLRKLMLYWWPTFRMERYFGILVTPVTHIIMYANCAINPIIYAFMSKAFRDSFVDLLCCRLGRRGRSGQLYSQSVTVKGAMGGGAVGGVKDEEEESE